MTMHIKLSRLQKGEIKERKGEEKRRGRGRKGRRGEKEKKELMLYLFS